MTIASITNKTTHSFFEQPKRSLPKTSKIEKAALLAFACISAYYSLPVCLLGLGSYAAFRYATLPAPVQRLPYHPNDLKLSQSKSAGTKLKNEFALAQAQAKAQKSRGFFSHSFASLGLKPCQYEIASETDASLSVGIAHAQGPRDSMEDFHIATSGSIPAAYWLFAIIDGHGGTQVGRFVKEHLQAEIEKALQKHGLRDQGIRNALKEAFVQLDAKMPRDLCNETGAAAVVSLVIGDSVWTANLGDSRAVLKAGKQVFQLSVDAKPNDPRFKRSIEKRGGWVEEVYGVPRVNGVLACARAFGDKALTGVDGHYVISPRPKITKFDLSPFKGQEIDLLQACDGIWDVASTQEAAKIAGSSDPEEEAARLVRAALNAGSQDNCSALIARLAK